MKRRLVGIAAGAVAARPASWISTCRACAARYASFFAAVRPLCFKRAACGSRISRREAAARLDQRSSELSSAPTPPQRLRSARKPKPRQLACCKTLASVGCSKSKLCAPVPQPLHCRNTPATPHRSWAAASCGSSAAPCTNRALHTSLPAPQRAQHASRARIAAQGQQRERSSTKNASRLRHNPARD